eukprot:2970434-Pyramimonas_sp.AAC.1
MRSLVIYRVRIVQLSFVLPSEARSSITHSHDADVLLLPRLPNWLQHSVAHTWLENYKRLVAIAPRLAEDDVHEVQKKVFRLLRSRREVPPIAHLLGPRIRYFWPEAPWEVSDAAFRCIHFPVKRAGPFAAVSHIKTICNAWPTTRRFRQGTQSCRFGCKALFGDAVDHYLHCPAALSVLPVVLPNLPPDYAARARHEHFFLEAPRPVRT